VFEQCVNQTICLCHACSTCHLSYRSGIVCVQSCHDFHVAGAHNVKCVYGKEYCRKLALCEEGERACFLWMLLTEIIAFNKACFYCLAFEWIDLFTSSHLHCCISACVCLSEMHGRCAHTVLLYCACVVVSMHWCVCVCVCEGERGTVTLILI